MAPPLSRCPAQGKTARTKSARTKTARTELFRTKTAETKTARTKTARTKILRTKTARTKFLEQKQRCLGSYRRYHNNNIWVLDWVSLVPWQCVTAGVDNTPQVRTPRLCNLVGKQ